MGSFETRDIAGIPEVRGDEEVVVDGRSAVEALVSGMLGELPGVGGQRATGPPPGSAAPSAVIHLHVCIQAGGVPGKAAGGVAGADGAVGMVVLRGVGGEAGRGGAGDDAVAGQVREGTMTVILWRGGDTRHDGGVGGTAWHR